MKVSVKYYIQFTGLHRAYLVEGCIILWGLMKNFTLKKSVWVPLPSCSLIGFLAFNQSRSPHFPVYCRPKYSFSSTPIALQTCSYDYKIQNSP